MGKRRRTQRHEHPQQRHARRNAYGVDVCVGALQRGQLGPACAHGPTLLFEQFFPDRPPRKFYACSACRDKANCSFFVWEDELPTNWADADSPVQQPQPEKPSTPQPAVLSNKGRLCAPGQFRFCRTCERPVPSPTAPGAHAGCDLTAPLDAVDLLRPTLLLPPKSNAKANAQFFFSDGSVGDILRILSGCGHRRVLCIGSPRIHEAIQLGRCVDAWRGAGGRQPAAQLDSLLLDWDARFEEWYGPSFVHFNMFNGHLFGAGAERLSSFLTRCDAVVVDPPFGGVLGALAAQLRRLWARVPGTDPAGLPTLLCLPYFNERDVERVLPELKLTDLQLNYTNHSDYHAAGRKAGSPVRVFTNIPPKDFVLPQTHYRFCKPCQRYVAKTNRHCDICRACPSKDGTTYRHCGACGRCVKPKWVHCDVCARCQPVGHLCSSGEAGVCHRCGMKGHRRQDCPQLAS